MATEVAVELDCRLLGVVVDEGGVGVDLRERGEGVGKQADALTLVVVVEFHNEVAISLVFLAELA